MYNELNIGQQALVLLFFAGGFAFIYMLLAIGFRQLKVFIASRQAHSFDSRLKATVAMIEANKKLSNKTLAKLKKAGRNRISC